MIRWINHYFDMVYVSDRDEVGAPCRGHELHAVGFDRTAPGSRKAVCFCDRFRQVESNRPPSGEASSVSSQLHLFLEDAVMKRSQKFLLYALLGLGAAVAASGAVADPLGYSAPMGWAGSGARINTRIIPVPDPDTGIADPPYWIGAIRSNSSACRLFRMVYRSTIRCLPF
jgi:hypothetical protein